MQQCSVRFTVCFQDPFWVGVCEREEAGRLSACKITFGAEPSDQEVHRFLLEHWHRLVFSPAVFADAKTAAIKNPKRRQRAIRRQLERGDVGTRAQQAIKAQQAQGREARKRKSRLEREQEQERLFALRREKKKQKHRGH